MNDNGAAAKRLQEWLNILVGANLTPDGNFGPRTRAALQLFQTQMGLLPDGVFGRVTFTTMRDNLRGRLSGLGRLSFVKCPAHKAILSDGVDFFEFRADVVPAYMRLFQRVKNAGALITSVGAKRALSDSGRPNTSLASLHYPAIAFDLALDTGCKNPEKDAYVIERASDGRWTVWARCFDVTSPEYPKADITIKNPVTYNARRGTNKPVTGRFINFTALANAEGFNHIPPHRGFETTKAITALEWWHFQYELVLMPGFSTFGDELRAVYSENTLASFYNIRVNLPRIWKVTWHG